MYWLKRESIEAACENLNVDECGALLEIGVMQFLAFLNVVRVTKADIKTKIIVRHFRRSLMNSLSVKTFE